MKQIIQKITNDIFIVSFELFKITIDKISREVLSFLFKGELPNQGRAQVSEAQKQQREKLNLMTLTGKSKV